MPNTDYNDIYKLKMESLNEVIWEWNFNSKEYNIIGNWKEITGFEINEIKDIRTFIEAVLIEEDRLRLEKQFESYIKGEPSYFQNEFRICTKKKDIKWLLVRGQVIKDLVGNPLFMVGSISDSTEIRNTEEQMKFMAYHDMLTGLPNRALFMERLKTVLEEDKLSMETSTLLFIDLDNFKRINDTLGHHYGDLLLKIVAQLLFFCAKDIGYVARFGGDEFLVLLPKISLKEEISSICDKIIQSFKDPFELKEKQIYCSVSIGICNFYGGLDDVNDILKNVDTAMYYSKSRGKNTYSFFDESMYVSMLRKTNIETSLRDAISDKELELYYQPQVSVEDHKIRRVEALLRWNSRELGSVSPNEFIPISEETGIIIKIGEWVINSACEQLKIWKDKGYKLDTISINISPNQMEDKALLKIVKKALRKNYIERNELEIEITEGTLIKSVEEKSEMLNELVDIGIRVSIDDFGKGYSSLNYLTVLPIHTLKIDKAFIDRICDSKSYYAIVECIIQLAKRLDYEIIAEGVETEEQYNILKNLNCDIIQGYYFSKPLKVEQLEELLEK